MGNKKKYLRWDDKQKIEMLYNIKLFKSKGCGFGYYWYENNCLHWASTAFLKNLLDF